MDVNDLAAVRKVLNFPGEGNGVGAGPGMDPLTEDWPVSLLRTSQEGVKALSVIE